MLGHERHHRVHETIDAFGTLAKFVSGSNATEAEDRGLDTAYNDYGALHPPLYPPTIPEYYDYGAQVIEQIHLKSCKFSILQNCRRSFEGQSRHL